MPLRSRYVLVALGTIIAACQTTTAAPGGGTTLPPPQNLSYQLDPSGNPSAPSGMLLLWDDVASSSLAGYRVYSRTSTTGSFGLRGETSSNTFHDNGVPELQYAVSSMDVNGSESPLSNAVTVDQRLQLPAPASISSIALDSAIHLDWADNAFQTDPTRFKWYRVYSASYSLDSNACGNNWALEGTTVSHTFLVAQLANGVPRCFATSAISVEGYESLWSPLWQDTPRPDGRNALVYAFEQQPTQSGFRFWNDLNGNGYPDLGELGLIQDGSRTDIDFYVHLQASDSTLWIVPAFAGDSMHLFGSQPIADLTSIHTAPAGGYTRNMVQAVPGYGYVFQRNEAGAYHYMALRVTAVTRQYVIFDWAVQSDPGNPELVTLKPPSSTATVVPVSP
jgi:hypothetical protein